MYDLFVEWNGDLAVGAGGDLAVSSGRDVVNQRIYRRLLTNPGDYMWNLDYGGGLGQFVGIPANPTDIEAVATEQLALESAVPQTPTPQVGVKIANQGSGYVLAHISYADPSSNIPVSLVVTSV